MNGRGTRLITIGDVDGIRVLNNNSNQEHDITSAHAVRLGSYLRQEAGRVGTIKRSAETSEYRNSGPCKSKTYGRPEAVMSAAVPTDRHPQAQRETDNLSTKRRLVLFIETHRWPTCFAVLHSSPCYQGQRQASSIPRQRRRKVNRAQRWKKRSKERRWWVIVKTAWRGVGI